MIWYDKPGQTLKTIRTNLHCMFMRVVALVASVTDSILAYHAYRVGVGKIALTYICLKNSSMAASQQRPLVLIHPQSCRNRFLYAILLSLSPVLGKNYQFLLKCIFYFRDNQALRKCETEMSKLHILMRIIWPRHIIFTESERGSVLAT